MAPERFSPRRYRCTFCGLELRAWLHVAKRPEASMRLDHLGQHHPEEVGLYLARMAAGEDIAATAAECYEEVEDQDGAS
jgi:hypothetical protein